MLEYLEDPTPGIDGMAEVARQAPMPLATNMCVVAFGHLPPAIRQNAVQVILSDHHYWGGLRRSALLAGICETFGIGLSMHSNSHLGISLAAMVHLAAATPNLTYACDTHWPWKTEDVVPGEPFTFSGGASRSRPALASASNWTGTPWPGCTSSTWPAACAAGTTPATCDASPRLPAHAAPLVRPEPRDGRRLNFLEPCSIGLPPQLHPGS